jgi:hypothetical protein
VTRQENLSIDALDHEDLEVWQPLERTWGGATVLPDHPEAASVTFAELADALHVARGTITIWASPEFDGPTKIFAHEVLTGPDGIKYVAPEVLLRLMRNHAKGGLPKANGFSASAQKALPAGTAVWKSNGNHS